ARMTDLTENLISFHTQADTVNLPGKSAFSKFTALGILKRYSHIDHQSYNTNIPKKTPVPHLQPQIT
ncbi:hypothetical protein, partial [Microseira sp. BLCC-F43]|uniref:hypothetical protein n=1 Tax=Microseira sp. BLCC-F43 TaxID=3153602 RepID=UPI0035B753D4